MGRHGTNAPAGPRFHQTARKRTNIPRNKTLLCSVGNVRHFPECRRARLTLPPPEPARLSAVEGSAVMTPGCRAFSLGSAAQERSPTRNKGSSCGV